MPGGNYLALGGSGHTALYNTVTKVWTAGIPFTTNCKVEQFYIEDAPAEILPNGNVIKLDLALAIARRTSMNIYLGFRI